MTGWALLKVSYLAWLEMENTMRQTGTHTKYTSQSYTKWGMTKMTEIF